jgi:hypothetical protein
MLTAPVTPRWLNMGRERIGNAAAIPERTKMFIAKALFALARYTSMR